MSLALLALAQNANAELSAAFRDKIDVDVEYAPGVGQATDIAFHTDGRAVITRKDGTLTIRSANGTLKQVSSLFPMIDARSEKGLLGVVADPGVEQNNTFYFYVSQRLSDTATEHRVLKGVLTVDNNVMIDAMPIIAASRNNGPALEGPNNHDGGGLFIHKGKLYIGVGDTGFNDTPAINRYGSCLNKGNGKLLRVNLDGSIPDDNPLVNVAMVSSCDNPTGGTTFGMAPPDKRIFAWGLRNPWRLWVDSQTDLFWIGDVGETTEEEISVGKGGEHFGYPFVEGSTNHAAAAASRFNGKSCMDITPARPCTAPVFAYETREAGGMKNAGRFEGSITGGLIPTGCGWDEALGGPHYLYGDYVKNWIRALPVNSDRTGLSKTEPVAFEQYPAGSGPVSFRMGPDQSLYIVSYEASAVYRYTPKSRTGPGCDGGTGGGGMGAGGSSGSGTGGATTAGAAPVAGGPAGGTTSAGAPGKATGGAPGMTAGAGGTTQSTGGQPVAGGTVGAGGARAGAPATGGGAPMTTAGASSAGAPPGGSGSGADGGCGCRMAGSDARNAMWAAAAAAFAGFTWRRRRRSKTGQRSRSE